MSTQRACYYCGEGPDVDEMRPYGPGGSWIHFDCMVAAPEREAAAKQNFGALLDAAEAAGSGITAIGEDTGPRPFSPAELLPEPTDG